MRTTAVFLITLISIVLLFWQGAPQTTPGTFRAEQMKYSRVKAACTEKWNGIDLRLKELDVQVTALEVFIRSFKHEKVTEVWVKNKTDKTWKKYRDYKVCMSSGELGPKRCQGDGQVPEGFYHMNIFNPYSNFHLSLGVSYPNASDRVFACKRDPGGAIMIHGDCVTIGCIPLTDDKIKEVYVLCVEARNAGQQKIPIHILPTRLSEERLREFKATTEDASVKLFWDNLKTGHDYFETKTALPVVTVDAKGKYIFR